MSARERLARADELIEQAASTQPTDPSDDSDAIRLDRFELLLMAVATAMTANAAALIEYNEMINGERMAPQDSGRRHAGA
jgi:hypothetical protein